METDLTEVIGMALLAIYEVAVRIYPTIKDWSFLNLALRILNVLVPNRTKSRGRFEITELGPDNLKRRKFLGLF